MNDETQLLLEQLNQIPFDIKMSGLAYHSRSGRKLAEKLIRIIEKDGKVVVKFSYKSGKYRLQEKE